MSELVYGRRGGILTVERTADFASVEAALKAFDRDLVLNVEPDVIHDRLVYQVHKVISRDRPAVFILSWRDELGVPLPLSSALVDEAKRLHPSSRGDRGGLSTDQLSDRENAAIRGRETAETLADTTEVLGDMLPRIRGKRLSPLRRGLHLARARGRTGRLQ